MRGHTVGASIIGALFITGGLTFVGAAAAGGGARGRRADMHVGLVAAPEMPFTGVLIGLTLIGFGVLAAVL
jgi:hypothetical protein